MLRKLLRTGRVAQRQAPRLSSLVMFASAQPHLQSVHVFTKTPQTLDEVLALFQPPEELADFIATSTGRGSNQWTSPDGCLMFTVSRLTKIQGAQAPFINYLVCMAVVEALTSLTRDILQGQDLNIRVKWPNDIYHNGQKIAGALINTASQGANFRMLIGVGLNLANRQPTLCVHDILRAALPPGTKPSCVERVLSQEAVLAAILNHLEAVFVEFEAFGWAPLAPRYLAMWLHSGQRLTMHDGAEVVGARAGAAPGSSVSLVVTGISPGGFLLAEDDGGAQYELTPDGNSLDMMQGLIRRKLQA